MRAFTCGIPEEDEFLKCRALIFQRKGMAATTVAVQDGRVIGYYALCSTSVVPEALPRKQRLGNLRLSQPATLLAQLAVASEMQGKGYGGLFLAHAMRASVLAARTVASRFVILDAREEALISYYQKFGFRSLSDNPRRMYVRMDDIEKKFPEK